VKTENAEDVYEVELVYDIFLQHLRHLKFFVFVSQKFGNQKDLIRVGGF
jgi:hypothetical protein